MLLVNYGALVDEKNKVYIAGGTRIVLPTHIAKEIYKGRELGDIMEEFLVLGKFLKRNQNRLTFPIVRYDNMIAFFNKAG